MVRRQQARVSNDNTNNNEPRNNKRNNNNNNNNKNQRKTRRDVELTPPDNNNRNNRKQRGNNRRPNPPTTTRDGRKPQQQQQQRPRRPSDDNDKQNDDDDDSSVKYDVEDDDDEQQQQQRKKKQRCCCILSIFWVLIIGGVAAAVILWQSGRFEEVSGAVVNWQKPVNSLLNGGDDGTEPTDNNEEEMLVSNDDEQFEAATAQPTKPTPTDPPTPTPYSFSECSSTTQKSLRQNTSCCNGLASNCPRPINTISFATVHNAMSSRADKFLGANNIHPLEDALVAGYRGLLLDLCDCGDGSLKFCHGSCSFGERDVREVLENIVGFLRENEGEVVMIVVEMGKSSEGMKRGIGVDELYGLMEGSQGFLEMVYKAEKGYVEEWPIMQFMIENNKRIIVFQHEGTSCTTPECSAAIHNYFDYVVDTPWAFKTVESMQAYTASCEFDRGKGGDRFFYNVNHFVTNLLPSANVAEVVNVKDFVMERITKCSELNEGRVVNMVTVDFWGIGDIPEVVQTYNKGLSLQITE